MSNENPVMTIHTLDKQRVEIQSIPRSNVMDFVDSLTNTESDEYHRQPVFQFTIGEGASEGLVLIPRRSIARVDVVWEPSIFSRIRMFFAGLRDRMWN